jgi:hypothetical protein
LEDEGVPALPRSDSGLTLDGRCILAAINGLPEGEREAFGLVRIRGMPQTEAAEVTKAYPLSQAPDAWRYQMSGHTRGEVVLEVSA